MQAAPPPDWEPHRELLHGIQHLRKELDADFSVMTSELRITDPSPEGIERQLAAIRDRARASRNCKKPG